MTAVYIILYICCINITRQRRRGGKTNSPKLLLDLFQLKDNSVGENSSFIYFYLYRNRKVMNIYKYFIFMTEQYSCFHVYNKLINIMGLLGMGNFLEYIN